ncbi:MAG: type II secretion system protein [Sedimentisphaerales bacterium]|nr:type II secretion system protein [Sedimentisphaerales bacterium]
MVYRTKKNSAFTLVEVMASIFLIGILLAGILLAYTRSVDNLVSHTMDERALAVAQRQIEILIATGQEPETSQRQGRDLVDPVFIWHLNLERVSATGEMVRYDLSNSVIKATVTVEHEGDYWSGKEPFELVRYFNVLRPIAGQAVAVPQNYEAEPEPWYLDLQRRLGREPTAEETFEEMERLELLPPGALELLNIPQEQ